MPSSSDTLRVRDTKFGTGVQCNKVFQNWENLGGSKILGGQNFDFSKKNYFHHFWANYAKINKFWSKKIFDAKNLKFFEIPHYDFGTAGDV